MSKVCKTFVHIISVILTATGICFYSEISISALEDISLTVEEINFIKTHPVIIVGVDPKFVPFEFIDDEGDYKGIAADHLDLISELTGLRFEVQRGITWPEAYDRALSGEIDLLPAVSVTEERKLYFRFSEPYHNFRRVIVTRNNDTGIADLDDLKGLTVAVQRNSSHHSYLLSYHDINLSLYDSVESALMAVSNGKERVFLGNLATTDHLIRTNAITGLKFIAFEAEKQQSLHMAVRKDWPELISILNKSFDSISDEEKIAISNKWIKFEADIDHWPIIRAVLIFGTVFLIFLGVSFYWIGRLRREIRIRQEVQHDLEDAKIAAEKANEVKSVFLARMSHEIRTPLNAITGITYLLKESELSQTQISYADRISSDADNMLGIINDILDFSKIESGRIEFENISFSPGQVIQNVVGIISYRIEEKKLDFRSYADTQLPDRLTGDPKRLEQILLNLLNNAVKFTDEGKVGFEVRLVAKEGNMYHLSFTVKDTGIGMTEEQVSRLFTPFEQADSSINRRFGGSGLGLSIVKNLVDLMNGRISVFSTPGEGSVFVVYLSFVSDKENDAGTQLSKDVKVSRPDSEMTDTAEVSSVNNTVLLAEDNKTNQLIATSLLNKIGCETLIANNGQEALEIFTSYKESISLVLMDIHMPVMNGYEASEKIREMSADIPIVAMTADVISGVKEKCTQSGMFHYISKPYDPDGFIRIVKELLDKQKGESIIVRKEQILDTEFGIMMTGGDPELFRQVLNEFYSENHDVAVTLKNALSNRDYKSATQMVHKLKGSSGSIGAKSFYEAAKTFQKLLAEGDEIEIEKYQSSFIDMAEGLLSEISSYCGRRIT